MLKLTSTATPTRGIMVAPDHLSLIFAAEQGSLIYVRGHDSAIPVKETPDQIARLRSKLRSSDNSAAYAYLDWRDGSLIIARTNG